jgi:hypothetical protein
LRVTFDTNTLDPVTRPTLPGSPRGASTAIHEALRSKQLEGFFCETLLTVEGGGRDRQALRPETAARMTRAMELGMRILSAPRIGSVRIDDPTGDRYVADADESALALRLERYESIAAAIEKRGLGFARVLKLARRLARRAPAPEHWTDSLKRATEPGEPRKVARAVAEWADGDSVAAHHGYGNDLFCTEDRAGKAGRDSVMHPAYRNWLRRGYGVHFVTLAELAALLLERAPVEVSVAKAP